MEWSSTDRPDANKSSEYLWEPSSVCTSGKIAPCFHELALSLTACFFKDLANLGSSWIFPISKSAPRQSAQSNVLGNSKSLVFHTSYGNVNRSLLHPTTGYKEMLPTGA